MVTEQLHVPCLLKEAIGDMLPPHMRQPDCKAADTKEVDTNGEYKKGVDTKEAGMPLAMSSKEEADTKMSISAAAL